jgi:hypothetical protein
LYIFLSFLSFHYVFVYISLFSFFFTFIHLTLFYVLFLQSLQLQYFFMPWKRSCKTIVRGTRWRSWLRRCAINRKVAVPMEPLGCFIDSHSDRTVIFQTTQPVTEMNNTKLSPGDKVGRCVGLTRLPPCADCLEILGGLSLLEP